MMQLPNFLKPDTDIQQLDLPLSPWRHQLRFWAPSFRNGYRLLQCKFTVWLVLDDEETLPFDSRDDAASTASDVGCKTAEIQRIEQSRLSWIAGVKTCNSRSSVRNKNARSLYSYGNRHTRCRRMRDDVHILWIGNVDKSNPRPFNRDVGDPVYAPRRHDARGGRRAPWTRNWACWIPLKKRRPVVEDRG